MPIAAGSRHSIGYALESAYGAVPASPTWSDVRHTGCTLGLSKETVESEEIRPDRQTTCFRHGNRAIGGDIEGELSYSSYDTILEACLGGTWTGDVLKVGNSRRSFTFQRRFQGLDTAMYLRYTGCEINSVSLSVAPNSMVGISVNIVGQNQIIDTAAVSGASFEAVITTCQFDSFNCTITEGGSPVAIVTSVDLSIENNLEPYYIVGDDETVRPALGRCRVSGTATVYFEDEAMLNKFANETDSSLVLLFTDPDGNTLKFDIPKLKYNAGKPDVSGTGAVTISMPFIGIYDDTDESTIVITRNPI
jgi:hypothetical protein